MLVFGYLAFRSEVNTDKIRKNTETIEANENDTRASLIAQCEVNNANATSLNVLIDQIIHAVETAPNLTDEEKAQRIKLYSDAKPNVTVNCHPSR